MLSVRDFEIATQIVFPEFEQSSCSLLRLYCIDPSEHCAVAVWVSDRNNAETDQRCGVISLVTTRSKSPTE